MIVHAYVHRTLGYGENEQCPKPVFYLFCDFKSCYVLSGLEWKGYYFDVHICDSHIFMPRWAEPGDNVFHTKLI